MGIWSLGPEPQRVLHESGCSAWIPEGLLWFEGSRVSDVDPGDLEWSWGVQIRSLVSAVDQGHPVWMRASGMVLRRPALMGVCVFELGLWGIWGGSKASSVVLEWQVWFRRLGVVQEHQAWFWCVWSGSGASGMVLECQVWFQSVWRGSGVAGLVQEYLLWPRSIRHGFRVAGIVLEHQAWFRSVRPGSGASGLVPEHQAWFGNVCCASGASGLVLQCQVWFCHLWRCWGHLA